jgi:hypothetical protein
MNIPPMNDSSQDDLKQPDVPPESAGVAPGPGSSQMMDAKLEEELHDPPTKICPKCSVQNKTDGKFCPNCGASYETQRFFAKFSKRVRLIIAAVLIVMIGGIGISLSIQNTNRLNAEQAAAAEAEAEKKKESEAAAAKKSADDAQRTVRKAIVTELEASILEDAQDRVWSGDLRGPITLASCTPLGGGSSDDLTAITGTFQCIAVNKTNADGSSSGYRFSATVNWNDLSYSWHLGS